MEVEAVHTGVCLAGAAISAVLCCVAMATGSVTGNPEVAEAEEDGGGAAAVAGAGGGC